MSRQSRRSLRHSSLTLDNVLSVSTDLIDQFSGSQFSQLCSSQCSSLCDGLITLPRYPARVPTRSESSDQEKIDSENNNDVDSLHTFPATNTIRVYATCLRPHLAYKTVMITPPHHQQAGHPGAPQQVQDEAQGPQAVLPDHGGDRQSNISNYHAGRQFSTSRNDLLQSMGRMEVYPTLQNWRVGQDL